MTKQEYIHSKGFNMARRDNPGATFNKIKVGPKTLEDATLSLGSLKHTQINYGNKMYVLQQLATNDITELREISRYFYNTSGIYSVVCDYIANLYRYDWYIVSEIYDSAYKEDESKISKVVKDFNTTLSYLDNTHIKKLCGDIALDVVREGAYYGYVIKGSDQMMIQQLPIDYCRSRYNIGTQAAIEFNMKFFDDKFPDVNYRMRVLKLFPKEFQTGYVLYKQHKLTPDFTGDVNGGCWYLLDPNSTVKFSFNNGDKPLFVNAIPNILDLDAAQDLDRRKQMQKLLKIIIQKLPLDKNGDLIFDIDEATDIHNNAVQMLKRAIGVDVMTTFADVESIDMSDKTTTTSTDDLEKVERTVYNALGISQNLFNTEGSIALEKSILNDEAKARTLLLQFHIFFDKITQECVVKNKKKYNFRFYMLETTQYNYRDISKMFKEQVQIGYSMMLPQIALGVSQSAILNAAVFEKDILLLNQIMIPPLMSSVLSGEDILGTSNSSNTSQNQDNTEGGRSEKPDDEKSDKTIANQESQQ